MTVYVTNVFICWIAGITSLCIPRSEQAQTAPVVGITAHTLILHSSPGWILRPAHIPHHLARLYLIDRETEVQRGLVNIQDDTVCKEWQLGCCSIQFSSSTILCGKAWSNVKCLTLKPIYPMLDAVGNCEIKLRVLYTLVYWQGMQMPLWFGCCLSYHPS